MGTHKGLSWVVVFAGLWQLIAPFAFGYSNIQVVLWNSIIVGVALMILGIWAAVSSEKVTDKFLDWVNLLIGAWLFIAPFTLAYTAVKTATYNDVIIGLLVIALTGWGIYAIGHEHPQTA